MTIGINEKEDFLRSLFKDSELFLGDELKDKLIERFGISESSARQVVSRAAQKGVVLSTRPVSFGKNTYAYHLPFRKITLEDLLYLSRQRRPPLGRLIAALVESGGIVSYYEALKIAATPLVKTNSKISHLDDLLKELEAFKLATVKTDKKGVKYILGNSITEKQEAEVMAAHFAKMSVDAMFIYDVLNTLKRLNLIDNEQVIYRNRKFPSRGALHNNFVWDAYGYTKSTGINTVHGSNATTSSKQALVVLDVVISREYQDFDLDGFLARVQVLMNHSLLERKIVPIIVYHTISEAVLNRARSFGALTFSMAGFYGTGIDEVIANVGKIKRSEYALDPKDISTVKVINESLKTITITGNEINLQNVIGDFFQSLMYQLLKTVYPDGDLEQAVKLPALDDSPKGTSYEYDFIVRHSRTRQIIFFEVKGYRSESVIEKGDYDTKNTLKWFFGRTFPSGRKHYEKEINNSYKVRSVFITSAKFNQEGTLFLAALNNGDQKPLEMDVSYNGTELLKLVEQKRLTLLKSTLERYFFKTKNR